MSMIKWALKWGVSPAALADLHEHLGFNGMDDPNAKPGESETAVSARVRLEASRKGHRLWRNNVGVLTDAESLRPVRFGLCNDSKELNGKLKSCDLIGGRRVLITPQHVGYTLLQFMGREVKAGGWKYTGTDREVAQLAFINLVNSLGGDAAFAAGEGTV